jgi:guanylate kinase
MSSEPAPRRGLLLVVSSPSGAGKTTLTRRLAAEYSSLSLSISTTTRAPRPGEVDGREYIFVTPAQFQALIDDGAFLEWAVVHENRYGTPRAGVMAELEAGRDLLFDIDWQGAGSIAAAAADDTVRVFILPPSMEELSRRLHARAQDAEEVIARRLDRARGEIARWRDYDYVLVNDDLERAYWELASIYRAERLRRARNLWAGELAERLAREGPGA